MSYNSYGKNDYYSGGRGGYNDNYHGGSRRGSPRGGGRNYSSRGGSNSYYQGGSSSRYQGNSNYGGGNYNQSSSRNDDNYRTVRYTDSPKTNYRSTSSYDSGSKRPRIDSDSRYGNSGGSSYKGSSYRHQDSYSGGNYSSSLKREYEKAKARDYIFNSNKGSMGPPPSRYTRGNDRPYRARGRGRGGYIRKPYGSGPSYLKAKLSTSFKRNPVPRSSYQVEKLRKLKRIQQLRARRR